MRVQPELLLSVIMNTFRGGGFTFAPDDRIRSDERLAYSGYFSFQAAVYPSPLPSASNPSRARSPTPVLSRWKNQRMSPRR